MTMYGHRPEFRESGRFVKGWSNTPIEVRLQENCIPEPNSGCHLFTGFIANGYGRIAYQGRPQQAHRLAYEAKFGPVPRDLVIDHLCRVRSCINPDHMEPVTQTINKLRGFGFSAINARKTVCKYGHPFDAKNTGVTRLHGRVVGRYCHTCNRAHAARVRAARQAARRLLAS